MNTPHSEQHYSPIDLAKLNKLKFLAITVAAACESYFRSALNATFNRRLAGTWGPLFPRMHIQIPTRVLYINGIKGLRNYVETFSDKTHLLPYPRVWQLCLAVSPGLIVAPISSILEATNAHLNTEPMMRRWMRGFAPRCVRESIFAVGINQMSEYFEERILNIVSLPVALSTTAGSIAAGVVAGYISHVPHNLSALKLMNPQQNYRQIIRLYSEQSESRLPVNMNVPLRRAVGGLLSIVAPIGVHIRMSQIVGSFVILNGLIKLFS